jgi:hypothetical protein
MIADTCAGNGEAAAAERRTQVYVMLFHGFEFLRPGGLWTLQL